MSSKNEHLVNMQDDYKSLTKYWKMTRKRSEWGLKAEPTSKCKKNRTGSTKVPSWKQQLINIREMQSRYVCKKGRSSTKVDNIMMSADTEQRRFLTSLSKMIHTCQSNFQKLL